MYSFLNRYCQITAHIPAKGIATLTGWITQADSCNILLIDEQHNEYAIKKEDLKGSVVVLLVQRERQDLRTRINDF